jgi:RNA polymerase sigma-70 factor (ECF subfamily)
MSGKHRHGSEQCREIFARLSEYLDGELPRDLCDQIDGHMGDCPPCQAFLKSLEQTVKLVESVETPTMPEEVRRAVREAWRRCGKDSD